MRCSHAPGHRPHKNSTVTRHRLSRRRAGRHPHPSIMLGAHALRAAWCCLPDAVALSGPLAILRSPVARAAGHSPDPGP
eukprot:scaffold4232_cov107-Isochrysis_galbana.AAC.2